MMVMMMMVLEDNQGNYIVEIHKKQSQPKQASQQEPAQSQIECARPGNQENLQKFEKEHQTLRTQWFGHTWVPKPLCT